MDNINPILVTEKKVSLISFSVTISCPIVGRIAQSRFLFVIHNLECLIKGILNSSYGGLNLNRSINITAGKVKP